MLPERKLMEVLEAHDLTRSLRSAALLCGIDHHTATRVVGAAGMTGSSHIAEVHGRLTLPGSTGMAPVAAGPAPVVGRVGR
jgi:hypothetical protein